MLYMPYRDFYRSAKCLSDQHLREQRAACRRIIGVMFSSQKQDFQSWMLDWAGHSDAVLWATDAALREMERRKLPGKWGVVPWGMLRATDPPPWLGVAEVHQKHRELLLAKDPVHYGRMGWR